MVIKKTITESANRITFPQAVNLVTTKPPLRFDIQRLPHSVFSRDRVQLETFRHMSQVLLDQKVVLIWIKEPRRQHPIPQGGHLRSPVDRSVPGYVLARGHPEIIVGIDQLEHCLVFKGDHPAAGRDDTGKHGIGVFPGSASDVPEEYAEGNEQQPGLSYAHLPEPGLRRQERYKR